MVRAPLSRWLLPLPLALGVLTGCPPKVPPLADDGASLARFESCAALDDYLTDAVTEALLSYRYSAMVDVVYEDDAGGDVGAPTDDAPSDTPDSYSATNNQEEAVDEADLVKTDGQHLYVAQAAGELTIVNAWPVEAAGVVGRVAIDGVPSQLLLSGGRALVFSQRYTERGSVTLLSFVDVSDPSAPAVRRVVQIDGALAGARQVGSEARLILNSSPSIPEEVYALAWADDLPPVPESYDEAALEAAKDEARPVLRARVAAALAALDGERPLLPQVRDGLPGEEPDAAPLMGCTDLFRPEELSFPSVLSVVQIDLSEPAPALAATGVVAEGWVPYASEDNLYVAQASWYWSGSSEGAETHIHRFAMDPAGPVYVGSAAVEGWVGGSYAMSEHDGELRVATTEGGWGWEGGAETSSRISRLDLRDDGFAPAGSLSGIAPGEQIYGVRFLGDTAYLVTFRQTDPLFVIDVPSLRTLGELEIPGFSSYLHPLDDTHLVTVGMDGTEEGAVDRLAVQVFDVSDPSAPTLAAKLVMSGEWSSSEALWDPHAFTLFNGVLSIPAYGWEGEAVTSGLWSVEVTPAALSDLGVTDHQDLLARSECVEGGDYGVGVEDGTVGVEEPPKEVADGGETSADAGTGEDDAPVTDEPSEPSEPSEGCAGSAVQVRRSVSIEGFRYSISDYGVKITPDRAPSEVVGEVLFWPKAE